MDERATIVCAACGTRLALPGDPKAIDVIACSVCGAALRNDEVERARRRLREQALVEEFRNALDRLKNSKPDP